MAIKQLSSVLSIEIKKRLMRKRPEETVVLLRAAKKEINQGFVESIDGLGRRKL